MHMPHTYTHTHTHTHTYHICHMTYTHTRILTGTCFPISIESRLAHTQEPMLPVDAIRILITVQVPHCTFIHHYTCNEGRKKKKRLEDSNQMRTHTTICSTQRVRTGTSNGSVDSEDPHTGHVDIAHYAQEAHRTSPRPWQ